jgi:membrane-bound lytic murein transglycosylase B
MTSSRSFVIGLALCAFLVLGAVGYVFGMPKPAPMVAEAPPAAAIGVQATGADGGGIGPGYAGGSGDAQLAASPSNVTIDPGWLERTSVATGIPLRALRSYATAAHLMGSSNPGCALGWNTLAAIGQVESQHGSHDGAVLQDDGTTAPAIIGPELNGERFAAVPDTDAGQLDGDVRWDRAVGPLQFIPSTWAVSGLDGDGDGVADPNDLDDAALAAAGYLCASGGALDTDAAWVAAVRSYNHDDAYVESVRQQALAYAEQTARAAIQ